MGVDIYALTTEWAPAVAAYRDAGSLDFYWQTDELPYLDDCSLPGGKAFLEAGYYYDLLRSHLPPQLREPADLAFGLVLPGDEEWMPADRDDLTADAGTGDGLDIIYAFRPSRAAEVGDIAVPWAELRAIADDHPVPPELVAPPGTRNGMYAVLDWDVFEWHAGTHLNTVAAAAREGRGIITVLSI